MGTRQRQEVERNYAAFGKMLPELMRSDANRFALMRDGKVLACFDTSRDALEAARRLLPGEPFSIQEVTDRAVDLGCFSHARVFGPV